MRTATRFHPGSLLYLAAAVALCVTLAKARAIDFSACESVTRAETVQIAEAYRTHRWKPDRRNAFHGLDTAGIRVDTPDISYQPADGNRPGWWIPNRTNEGMPYQWGGFDTPVEFDRKLREGKKAGDVYSATKRTGLDDAVSVEACGIDCSGFISRCWRLERSYSTRSLVGLCRELSDFRELEKGDLINKVNVHALLFVEWLDEGKTHFMAYETGSPPTWKVLRHPISVDFVKGLGYRPFRYRGIRE